ncbi:hypothetical protein EVAR_86618_1 [Eumeta japonica]|uniref:DUF4817 domain-containing protein n=1 Tax=Eumeta variegata TaxID=151549 RepID=A0A4C1W2M6_EUMVA|nr:hypothetical protein EVAR_86618_1 [Eumeta japonica]
MAAFTNEEHADIMMAHGRADGNARVARRIYEERFPNRRLPSRNTFQNMYRRLCETGNVQNNETRRVVVRHNVRIDEQILRLFEEDAPLDFYVWGRAKELVYATEVQNVEDLRERIEAAFQKIQQEMLLNTTTVEIRYRCRACIANGGRQCEQLL